MNTSTIFYCTARMFTEHKLHQKPTRALEESLKPALKCLGQQCRNVTTTSTLGFWEVYYGSVKCQRLL